MGRIVVTEFVSLDLVMEAPGGEPGYRHTGWVGRFEDAGQFEYKFQEVIDSEAHLLGRVTYESFAGAWPQREGEFADRINSMPKFVVSSTLNNPEWNNTSVLPDLDAVARLKQEFEGDLLVAGSRTLVNGLKERDLVDEYHLMVFPVVLGSGKRIFDDSLDAMPLNLADVKTYKNGIVVLTYQPQREPLGPEVQEFRGVRWRA